MPELGRLAGEFGLAAGLLTRLPVGWLSPRGAPGRAVWAYPLVGAAIGAAGAATLWLGRALHLPPLLAASWALLVPTLLSGALHEDGLADTADGFGGGATRERKLAIMRDSRIGGFGAVALILAFAVRGSALAALPPAALVAAAMLGRAAMAGVLWALPPARADGLAAGLGAVPGGPALAALALAAAGAVLLLPPRAALAGLLAGAGATLAAIALARRQIGGHTGDLCGATEQAVECVALTALAAVAG